MRTSYVHESATFVGINITGGSQYYVRARWATSAGLLSVPPVGVATPATYNETGELFVGSTPTADNPALLAVDGVWWQAGVPNVRTIFAVVEWHLVGNAAWQHFDDYQFIINHDPVANAGPDRVITLGPLGQIPADVQLDATASDDVDLHAAANADAGPLHYRWWPESLPTAVQQNGSGWSGAFGVTTLDQASPVLFAANLPMPATDQGEYRMRLYVEDNDPASIGVKAGQVGVGGASVSVIVRAAGSGVQILSPLGASPSFRSIERDRPMELRVFYQVSADVLADAAYAGGWIVRCRIRQEQMASPVALLSMPTGTLVFERSKTQVESDGFFSWNGLMSATAVPAASAVGSFSIEIELLDADGQSTGVAGSTAQETNAIVIDFVEYLLPVDLAFRQAAMNGAFMESGHAGKFNTRLHTGMDMVPSGGAGVPSVLASRSGFLTFDGGATNDIRLNHAPPDITHYLHSAPPPAAANGSLVLQGDTLSTMSNAGTMGVHLHFEYFQDLTAAGGALLIRNPLEVVPLIDGLVPAIEDVMIRQAPAMGGAADLALAQTSLGGTIDLIVRCRDRANPRFTSGVENAPYSMAVVDDSGLGGPWPTFTFETMTAAVVAEQFYERSGISPAPFDVVHQFLPFLRRDTTVYGQQVSPLRLHVTVADYFGHRSAIRDVTIGATVAVTMIPAPATSSANPQPFTVTLAITNNGGGLTGVANDRFDIALAGAPATWTISAGTPTPAINNGATRNVVVTVHPHGVAAAGMVAFSLVVSSRLLTQVAAVVPINVVIS
jgi:murein DD-endopeptidase MepM/ murein hydrolase activator NlpD